jgi:betaine-aldehyde dehydrogenase
MPELSELPELQNFVGGGLSPAADGRTSAVVDPSTGEAYLRAPVSGAADVDAALKVAASAFETWRDTTPAERSLALLRFASAIEARAEDLIEAESRNTGKPVAMTRTDEVPPLADELRFFAGCARILEGKAAGEYLRGHTSMVRREPIGVCA